MTTPGGVPNLPMGALTLDTLAADTQDMSGTAMKARAVERFPSIFNASTGLDPSLDITPFGILTRIWAEVNSLIANADPADVQGPDDIPDLVLQFIEGLPFVGQFVELLDAILGNYGGTDTTLLSIQDIFAPINAIVAGLTAAGVDPSNLGTALTQITDAFQGIDLTGDPGAILTKLDNIVFATGDEAPQYPPYTPPYTPSSTRQSTDFFALLRRFLAWGDITGSGFNFDTAVQNTIGTLLGQNMLAGLTNGTISPNVLPPELMNMLRQIISLGLPGATIPTGPADIITMAISAWTSWWSIITGTQTQATSTAAQASVTQAQVTALSDPTGVAVSLTDLFDYAAGPLPARHALSYLGPGGGELLANGDGTISWHPSGNLVRTVWVQETTPLATDYFKVELVMTDKIMTGLSNNNALFLRARANTAGDEDVHVKIFRLGNAGTWVADFGTRGFGSDHSSVLGQAQPFTPTDGDRYTFFSGTDGPRHFIFQQNGITVHNFLEGGVNSIMDASHRHVGFAMTAGNDDQGTQSLPGTITSVAYSDIPH